MSKEGVSLALFMSLGRLSEVAAALIMIKILPPIQMGIVALLSAIFIGLYCLTNFGFDRYLVRLEGTATEQRIIDNIWSLQLLRGLLIILVCVLLGITIPTATDFPNEITFELAGIGAALFITNLANPRLALFEREGKFRQIGISQGVSRISGSMISIGAILIFPSPWAFVIGKLIGSSLYVAFSYYFSRRIPHFHLDKQEVTKIWRFCRHLIAISAVSVIATQFENYYISIVFGAEVLGFYFVWARIISLPHEFFSQFSDKMLFSKACQVRRGCNCDLERYHINFIVSAFAVVTPFYYTIWFHGAWLISLVAGEDWVEYLWVSRYFVFISLIWMISLLLSPLILANIPELSSKLRSAEALLQVILIVGLGDIYGIEGVLIASLTSISIAAAIRIFIIYRYILSWWHAVRCCVIITISFWSVLAAASMRNGDTMAPPPAAMEFAAFLPGLLLATYILQQGRHAKGMKSV